MSELARVIMDEIRGHDETQAIPHPEAVGAIAEFVRAMCRVYRKAKNGKYPNDDWLGLPAAEHSQHAMIHSGKALLHHKYGTGTWIDDDGEHQLAHCGLRSAFAMAREKD